MAPFQVAPSYGSEPSDSTLIVSDTCGDAAFTINVNRKYIGNKKIRYERIFSRAGIDNFFYILI